MTDFTQIVTSRCAEGRPINEDLMMDLYENTKALHEHQVRTGSSATGVRIVLARGTEAFSTTDSDADHVFSGTVTYATEAEDGNPNFSLAPTIIIDLEADETTGDPWQKAVYNFGSVPAMCCVKTTGTSSFTYDIHFECVAHSVIYGKMHWTAVGFE